MSEQLDWNDIAVFHAVARHGGLSAAGRELGMSPPTVGRRVLALEQRSGLNLFLRSQTGYTLTPEGKALMDRVAVMFAAAGPVQDMLFTRAEKPTVRLSSGTATAQFLAGNIGFLQRPTDPYRLNFVTTETVLDIAHREIDLGIRNKPAEGGNLASRPLGTLRFAPYCNVAVNPAALGWVAVDRAFARHPAAKWLNSQGYEISVTASAVATVHALVRAGAGIGVMPCMIGDQDPQLRRAGPVIEELTEQQHLVMHADDRHHTPVRRVIDRLVQLYADNAALLAGDRPLRTDPTVASPAST